MAVTAKPTRTPIRWLDDDESRALFDAQAQAMLGISGAEFLRRWDAGEYAACTREPEASRVRRLVALIPFAR
jgi:hypothetical protein